MSSFRVWVRALGNSSRIRVEGNENARWLLRRLSQSSVFKGGEPLRQAADASGCTFEVPCSSKRSRSAVERLLGAIPEVTLMTEPE